MWARQAERDALQADLREASQRLGAAQRDAESASVQRAAEQQSRDAAALQARTQEVASVRNQADRHALCGQQEPCLAQAALRHADGQ